MKQVMKSTMAIIVTSTIVLGSVYAQGETKLSDPEIASVAVVANQIDINYAKIAKTRSKMLTIKVCANNNRRSYSGN